MSNYKDYSNDIAIIGMSGRFPGANNVEEFWQNLMDGVESIKQYTDEELLEAGVDPALLSNPNYIKAGAHIDNIDKFDAGFFGYNPSEAAVLDPQQRHFLEVAWETLEHAGYEPETFDGQISVFAGTGISRYLLFHVLPHRQRISQSLGENTMMLGSDKDYLTLRVSYKLNLKGASMSVQSACSTSLVGVHLGCQALLNNETDMVLAGGSTINPMAGGYLLNEGITSADGHLRSFDAGATGTVFGSGVGVVLLKRMEDALRDGDTVYAMIKGSALNNDGSNKVSFTAPSVDGQVRVISEALAVADIDPETVGLIETHGTGTALGDPIEFSALTQVFGDGTDEKNFCALGALKTNLGHLDTASGVTGLIKASLSLQNKVIPPTLHYTSPNPQIDMDNSPFFVNTEAVEFKANGDNPRRASLSSFGFGGTNAHVVLEEAPEREASGPSRAHQLLTISARDPKALDDATDRLVNHLKEKAHQNFADVAFTLKVGRKAFEHRRIVVATDAADAAEALEKRDVKRILQGLHDGSNGPRPTAFMFSGTGSQYYGMAKDLYEAEPTFRENVDRVCELLQPHLGLDLRTVIYPAEGQESEHDLYQTKLAQPALFAIEYSLAQLLIECGVQPEAMIGHSLGEYVAACLAGVFTVEEAAALVAKRAALVQSLPGGAMLAVNMTEEDLIPHLGNLSLAAINGPAQCVASGTHEAIDALQQRLTEQGISCTRVHTTHAFHSEVMDAIMDEFTEVVRSFGPRAPQIPFVSNVTGTWITAEEATDPRYWATHLRQAVRFADGIRTLCQDRNFLLLEVGPGKTLTSFALQSKNEGNVVLPSIRHINDKQSDNVFFLETLGKLWLYGVNIDWNGFYKDETRHRLPLPTYPFQRQRYWLDPVADADVQQTKRTTDSLNPKEWFYAPTWKQSLAPRLKADEFAAAPRNWLLFADESGTGEQLAQRLQALNQTVVTVKKGDSFNRAGENVFTLNPYDFDSYNQLIAALKEQGEVPDALIHMWSVTGNDELIAEGDAYFDDKQRHGFYSVLYLMKALHEHGVKQETQLYVLANNLHQIESLDVVDPAKTTVLGISKVIPQENQHFIVRGIDIRLPEGDRQRTVVVDQLLAEIQAQPTERFIAYRGRTRWTQNYELITTDEAAETPSRLRDKGVYLITGGFGVIGNGVATYLAETVQAKLVLIARGELNDARREQVAALEALGSEVLVVKADATNADEMKAAVEKAQATFGGLHGLFHAAGGTEEGYIADVKSITQAEVENNFNTKVRSLHVFDQVMADQKLDFVLLVSSLTTILGGLNCSAYVSAHHFMNAFAARKTEETDTPWITFDLDLKALEDTKEIYNRALSQDCPVPFVVSKRDLMVAIASWVNFEGAGEDEASEEQSAGTVYERPNLLTPYVEPSNETEERIAEFWQEVLGIDKIGIHDNFFELGGNSLVATNLVTRLRAAFEIDLPLRILFEASTIAELAVVIEDIVIEELLASADVGSES